MGHFEARTDKGTGHVRVTLTGECDLAVRDELHAVLTAAVRAAPLVIVDLGALEFLDSSGVHGLIVAHHEAQARGARVTLVNPTGAVAAVLDLTGVGSLLGTPAGEPAPAGQRPDVAGGESAPVGKRPDVAGGESASSRHRTAVGDEQTRAGG
ncbi:STAS domain-containing protein [Actinoplanes solisilvae]|uniref:STAS domain-containing protein n=1 Tax=Actinoplanes solisilvae TaxID=2486853 RepID=UPI000FD78387|nr:STAS domain-containing protein [Actinoplanes solisilvae]